MLIRLAFLALLLNSKQFHVLGQTPPFLSEVYENLYFAANNSKIGKPKLVYDNKNSQQIVTFRSGYQDGTAGELIVGHKFLELMRSFGKDSCNALAFVLGHEMAHIMLKQTDYIESLGSGYADKTLKKHLKVIKDSLYSNVFERQADEHASFYAHIAGYSTAHIGSAVLDAIYNEFNLPPDLKGYPNLEERKLIALTAGKRMQVLNKIYDAANLAVVSGKYIMAKRLFEILISEGFESKDIFNNCGVALTMMAIESDSTLQKYILPLFLDTESALDDNKLQRSLHINTKSFLEDARNHFDKAASRDYPIALLNLGVVAFLLQDYDEAIYTAKSALKHDIVQAHTLLGIIAHNEGNHQKAHFVWSSVEDKCPISKRNKILFFNTYASPLAQSNNKFDSIIRFELDLISPFVDRSFNARESDTLSKILKTKTLQYFRTSINETDYSRFKIKGTHDEVIHIALVNNFDSLPKENELLMIADKIFISNRYRFYRIGDKVIKYLPNGETHFFVIN